MDGVTLRSQEPQAQLLRHLPESIRGLGQDIRGLGQGICTSWCGYAVAGFTRHPTLLPQVEKNTTLVISGADKVQVGDFCATVRRQRPPEPYKGKGIRYSGEVIKLKEGKGAGGKVGYLAAVRCPWHTLVSDLTRTTPLRSCTWARGQPYLRDAAWVAPWLNAQRCSKLCRATLYRHNIRPVCTALLTYYLCTTPRCHPQKK